MKLWPRKRRTSALSFTEHCHSLGIRHADLSKWNPDITPAAGKERISWQQLLVNIALGSLPLLLLLKKGQQLYYMRNTPSVIHGRARVIDGDTLVVTRQVNYFQAT